jgi:hypothetical protein
MSRWLVITIAAVVITVALIAIGLIFFLKRTEVDDRAADEIFLKQKQDLLKLAINKQLQGDANAVKVESAKITAQASSVDSAVNTSNSKLGGLIAKQRLAIENLKKKYAEEMRKIKK